MNKEIECSWEVALHSNNLKPFAMKKKFDLDGRLIEFTSKIIDVS